jgi:DNA polymerase
MAKHSYEFKKKIVLEYLCKKCSHKKADSRDESGRDYCVSRTCSVRKEKELASNTRTARLYDIRNAGQHHRFTVSGKLVHNCGYGGSTGALKAMGALDMGLAEEELQPLVDSWRATNPNIVRFWWDVDRCVKNTVQRHIPTETHDIRFVYQSGMLFIQLPSGRHLSYVKPRMGENRFGGEAVTYEGVGGTKKWERIESYGPKFVENIIQAISRDILAYAMRTLSHYFICGHVHDELIMECSMDVSLDAICKQMGRTPPWISGLLLRADGYECSFYKKD